jgi:hypothetical protein
MPKKGLDPRLTRVEFVVDKVALWQGTCATALGAIPPTLRRHNLQQVYCRRCLLPTTEPSLKPTVKQLFPCRFLSFGWFPGVWILYADVSEHCLFNLWRCVFLLRTARRWKSVWSNGGIIMTGENPKSIFPLPISQGLTSDRTRSYVLQYRRLTAPATAPPFEDYDYLNYKWRFISYRSVNRHRLNSK